VELSPVDFWTLLLIALGLSADAFAVALGKGLHMPRLDWRRAAVIALTFGLFQAVMPLIGWLIGSSFADYIVDFDHWIAFALLAALGLKMLWEAFRGGDDDGPDEPTLNVRELLVLAVATSIDALAAGISFSFLSFNIWSAVALIGVITLVVSFIGVALGNRIGLKLGKPAEIAGGLILILIGTRILLGHLGVW
jgi:putative Mn2+ efflux pump MntP